MNEWQPIDTAPKDGSRILLTNGVLFAAGEREFYVEPEMTSDIDQWRTNIAAWEAEHSMPDPRYNGMFTIPKPGAPPKPRMPMMPNPKAGRRLEWWHTDPPSAFEAKDSETPDYDGNFDAWEPTHWQPLPAPPGSVVSQARGDK